MFFICNPMQAEICEMTGLIDFQPILFVSHMISTARDWCCSVPVGVSEPPRPHAGFCVSLFDAIVVAVPGLEAAWPAARLPPPPALCPRSRRGGGAADHGVGARGTVRPPRLRRLPRVGPPRYRRRRNRRGVGRGRGLPCRATLT
jgi:hypothetical protein